MRKWSLVVRMVIFMCFLGRFGVSRIRVFRFIESIVLVFFLVSVWF